MAGFNWDEYTAVDPNTKSAGVPESHAGNFNWNDFEHAPSTDPNQSPVTAATTGLIQGAVPFAGSLAGIGKAGMDAITGTRGPLAGGSMQDVMDDYRQARDEFGADASKSAEINPKTSFAASLAGGVANPLFKGGGLAKTAGAGALQSLGSSKADLTVPGNVGAAAVDSAFGAGAGALGYGLGKMIPKGIEAGKYLGKKALTNFGPSDEAIAARFAGKAQDDAPNFAQLAEDMAGDTKNLKGQVLDMSNDARATLGKSSEIADGAIPKEQILDSVDQALSKMQVGGKLIGPADKSAASALESVKADLDQLGPGISENDAKTIIQRLDDNINWDDQSQNRTNSLLEQVRHGIDSTLKFKNSKYGSAMEPVSDRARVLNQMQRQFSLRHSPTEGIVPTDATANKIQSSLKENKAVTQKLLSGVPEENSPGFKDFVGKDYQDLAKDYQLSRQFQTRSPQMSSKKTNIGAAIGAGTGYLLGGVGGAGLGTSAGALTGGAMDAYGGRAAAGIIDSIVKAGNSKLFGKFAPVLEQAARRGPAAMGATTTILMNNPEFQSAWDKAVGAKK